MRTAAYTRSVPRPVFTILVKYQKYLAYSLAWKDVDMLEEVHSAISSKVIQRTAMVFSTQIDGESSSPRRADQFLK